MKIAKSNKMEGFLTFSPPPKKSNFEIRNLQFPQNVTELFESLGLTQAGFKLVTIATDLESGNTFLHLKTPLDKFPVYSSYL